MTKVETALTYALPFAAQDVANVDMSEVRRLVRESEETAQMLARLFEGGSPMSQSWRGTLWISPAAMSNAELFALHACGVSSHPAPEAWKREALAEWKRRGEPEE